MKNHLNISVCIPAYNEASNIGFLLRAILKQTAIESVIEILVFSDASSDNTVEQAKKIQDKRIRVVNQSMRLGKNATLNNLFSKAKGAVLVQLDADVIPVDSNLIENLIKPINDAQADLVGADIIAKKPITGIEQLTTWGHTFRTAMYRKIHHGDNVYLCYGRARAFSKKYYKKLRFPNECPEDSYSYLFLKQIGGKFIYQKNAHVYFRSPASLSDYIHQSTSFVAGEKALQQFFPAETVKKAYEIPTALYIQAFWDCMRADPIRAVTAGIGYIALTVMRKLFIHVPNRYTSKYVYLSTTKTTSIDNGKIQ